MVRLSNWQRARSVLVLLFYLVSKVNTYAPANVRVEDGQQVVSAGMYALFRHPMYLGALFLVIGTPLTLGSWSALLSVPLSAPLLYFRIANEEKALIRGLPRPIRSLAQVRSRAIPTRCSEFAAQRTLMTAFN